MIRLKKWLFVLALTAVLTVGQVAPVLAQGTVRYQNGAEKFVFLPGSEYSASDLFTDFKDVMPGDTRTGTVEISNTGGSRVQIYLRALGAQEGTEDLLRQMHLTVEKDRETLSSASADSPGGLEQWILLGTFVPGESRTLRLTLEVPLAMDNDAAGRVGLIDWQFRAQEMEDTTPTTGDSGWMVWAAGILISGTGAAVLLRRRRQERNKH